MALHKGLGNFIGYNALKCWHTKHLKQSTLFFKKSFSTDNHLNLK